MGGLGDVRQEAAGGSINTSVAWSALSLLVSSVVIIILGLASEWAALEWLPMVIGLWIGLFLVWGAFRLFDWRGSTARAIYQRGLVPIVFLLVVLFVVGTLRFEMIPPTPAVTITFWAACGLILGVVTATG